MELSKRGVRTALVGRSADKLNETATLIDQARGAETLVLPADVTDASDVTAFVDQAVSRFDGIDILVNGAGVGLIKPLDDVTVSDIDRLFAVNVKGTILTTQAVLRRQIAAARGGSIVMIAGILGKAPMANASVYAASKYAVTGFAKSLQAEVSRKHNIKISVMYFGGVDSPFWDDAENIRMNVQRDKMIRVQDAADAIVYALTLPRHLVLGEIVLQPESHLLI